MSMSAAGRDWDGRLLRSLLFVPGSDAHKLGRVASFGADAIVIDLEDAVASGQKRAARALAHESIPACGRGGAAVIVRVNGIETGEMEADIAGVVRPELSGVIVPKLESIQTLRAVDEALAQAEREQGMPVGELRMLALIETAKGIVECERILEAAPRRTHTAIFGTADFSTELGVELTRHASELSYARSRLVVATRAAQMATPVDGPWLDLEDAEGLAEDCRRSRNLGFGGRVTIHPSQVGPVHDAYSALSQAEVKRAARVVAAFEEAQARGVASIRVDGQFVDYPIYRRAREQLRLAAAISD